MRRSEKDLIVFIWSHRLNWPIVDEQGVKGWLQRWAEPRRGLEGCSKWRPVITERLALHARYSGVVGGRCHGPPCYLVDVEVWHKPWHCGMWPFPGHLHCKSCRPVTLAMVVVTLLRALEDL